MKVEICFSVCQRIEPAGPDFRVFGKRNVFELLHQVAEYRSLRAARGKCFPPQLVFEIGLSLRAHNHRLDIFFEVYRDNQDKFRFRFVAPNGETMFSGQGYSRKQSVMNAIMMSGVVCVVVPLLETPKDDTALTLVMCKMMNLV